MREDLLNYLKTIYTNAVSIINYDEKGFSISVDFKFRWIDLEHRTTYHDGHCTVSKGAFNDYLKNKNGL